MRLFLLCTLDEKKFFYKKNCLYDKQLKCKEIFDIESK